MKNGKNSIYSLISKYRYVLMGIAALWILFYHEWQLITPDIDSIRRIECYIKGIGYVGVDIFLFLSGIGLPNSYKKSKSIGDFYLKRMKRILLPFLFMSIVIAITKTGV